MKKILISVIVLAIIVVILTNLLRTKNTLKYKASAVKSESEINNNASLNIKPKTKFKNAESSILINSSTAVRKVNQSDEVTKSCSSFIQINNQISVKEYLIRINDLDKNVINQCAHYIKKHFSQFDVDKCITEIEQLKIDGIRNDVYKTCSRFINLKFWNRFRFEFANKSIQQ